MDDFWEGNFWMDDFWEGNFWITTISKRATIEFERRFLNGRPLNLDGDFWENDFWVSATISKRATIEFERRFLNGRPLNLDGDFWENDFWVTTVSIWAISEWAVSEATAVSDWAAPHVDPFRVPYKTHYMVYGSGMSSRLE